MNIIHRCCCGIDVHAKTVVVCLIKNGKKQIRTCSTMTDDLLALSDWLVSEGCEQVAIESTGVYWKPVFNILEGVLEVVLVNARHVKAVPGRKTDVRDCEWLADLLRPRAASCELHSAAVNPRVERTHPSPPHLGERPDRSLQSHHQASRVGEHQACSSSK